MDAVVHAMLDTLPSQRHHSKLKLRRRADSQAICAGPVIMIVTFSDLPAGGEA
jgi:hypothetical protein